MSEATSNKYHGACRVTVGPGQEVEIPVMLTVWDFTLPAVPALETEFGSPAAQLRAYYRKRGTEGKDAESRNWAPVEAQCAQLLSEHRLNAVPPRETIRLKALRDAIEDYDYLVLLERQGKAAEADAIVAPLAGSFFSWEKNPAAYDQARAHLADLILSGSKRR